MKNIFYTTCEETLKFHVQKKLLLVSRKSSKITVMKLAIGGIFCLILDLGLSTPFDINCTLTVNESEYSCEMKDLRIDRNSSFINEMNVNETVKPAVKKFFVISYHTQSTHFLPSHICSYFTSLRVIDISANNL